MYYAENYNQEKYSYSILWFLYFKLCKDTKPLICL